MNPNIISHAAKADIATSVVVVVCIIAVAVAIEASAPIIAGIGAGGAAVAGIARVFYPNKKA